MATNLERLRAWAKAGDHRIAILHNKPHWIVTTSVDDPVIFEATAGGETVEDACEDVIGQLAQVGEVVP